MTFVTDSVFGIIFDLFFIVVVSVYLYWIWGLLRALRFDAPYVPMQKAVVAAMVRSARVKPGALWIDLGSGDGRVLIEAARQYDVRGVGIERVGSLRLWSRMRLQIAGIKRVTIRSGDFFKEDLSPYDVVSFYLLPETGERLFLKLQREMKPGAMLIFHRFPLPGIKLEYHDPRHMIYIARAPLVREKSPLSMAGLQRQGLVAGRFLEAERGEQNQEEKSAKTEERGKEYK